jgi:hypothetical protein
MKRATLMPLRQSPHVQPCEVTMIARTGNDKIKVQGPGKDAQIFAVYRFRLFDCQNWRRPIGDAEFNALPWQGKGPDPATASVADLVDHTARPT